MSTLSVNNVSEVGGAPVITSGVLDSGSLPAGSILQVVSTTKTDTFTMASTTFADITGLSATITPSSTSSKIFVSYSVQGAGEIGNTPANFRISRGGTPIAVGDAAGSRKQSGAGFGPGGASDVGWTASQQVLDSPNTTSATTYTIQASRLTVGGTVYVNRTESDADSSAIPRFASTITLMEVAG